MQIKFTKEEMEKLLELLTVADWVLTSQDVEDDERKDSYIKLLQRMYREAYENGMTKQIVYEEDIDEYFPEEEWEESAQVRDFIEEFEDATFWEELTYRLADRDIDRTLGGKAPKNPEEYMAMVGKVMNKYEEEFEKNNLENIEVIKPAKATKAPKAEKPAKAEKATKSCKTTKAAKVEEKPAAKCAKKCCKKTK